MPKRARRTAAQKAASRKNLEKARRQRNNKGNSILMGSKLSTHQYHQAEKHFNKADVFGAIIKGDKPKGKKKHLVSMRKMYGKTYSSAKGY